MARMDLICKETGKINVMGAGHTGKQICDFFHKRKSHLNLMVRVSAGIVQLALHTGGRLRSIKKRNFCLLHE